MNKKSRAAFTNPYYQSRFDNAANIQVSSLTAAAVVVAKALHNLAAGQETPQLQVSVQGLLFVMTALVHNTIVLTSICRYAEVLMQSECSDWFPIALSLHQDCPYIYCPYQRDFLICTACIKSAFMAIKRSLISLGV